MKNSMNNQMHFILKKKALISAFFIIMCHTLSAQNWDTKTLIQFTHHFENKKPIHLYSQSMYPIVVGLPASGIITGYIDRNEKLFNTSVEAVASLGITYISTKIIKHSIKRDRPYLSHPDINHYYTPKGYSMPSGHTSMAFSLATSISLNYPKWYYVLPSYIYAIGIGYSRMNLGVHYPSDVLVGGLLGIGSAVITHYGFQWLNKKSYYPRIRRFQKEDKLSLSSPPSYEMILQ